VATLRWRDSCSIRAARHAVPGGAHGTRVGRFLKMRGAMGLVLRGRHVPPFLCLFEQRDAACWCELSRPYARDTILMNCIRLHVGGFHFCLEGAAAFAGLGHTRLCYPRRLYGGEQRSDSRLRHRLTRSLGGKRRLVEPQPSRLAKRSSSLRPGKDAANPRSVDFIRLSFAWELLLQAGRCSTPSKRPAAWAPRAVLIILPASRGC
jgi:hypothetical protein